MPARRARRRADSRRAAPRKRSRGAGRTEPESEGPRGFVGRDPSPVLDRYPPKPYPSSGGASPRVLDRHADRAGPEPTASAPAAVPGGAGEAPTATEPPAKGLLSLERPFDVDDFAQQLGETTLRVTVPRDSLAEVLRRVADFMGFGIYVYAVRVQPAPSELLRSFVVELQRVDFSPADGAWVPFRELGRSESPFGPGGEPGARR